MNRSLLLSGVLLFASVSIGCTYADPSSVKVETNKGNITSIHQPGEWVTCWSPGCELYDVDLRPWTDDITIHTATKDNAPLQIHLKVTGATMPDKIREYLAKFGVDVETRHKKRYDIETGAVQEFGRDAVVSHSAYQVFAEQEQIQTALFAKLKDFYANQMYCNLLTVQIVEKPTFDNPQIEKAASDVVAAQKVKESEQQYKEAAQIKLEKEQIQNQIYSSSPQAFEIRKLELQRDIAKEWAQHQGPLVFGGSNLQVQIPGGRQ